MIKTGMVEKKRVFASYYEVLQVAPDARQEDIAKSYRALVKKYHPDSNPFYEGVAHNRLQILKDAYDALKTPERRAQYDARQKSGSSSWDSAIKVMEAKNDNPVKTHPFPWAHLARVGWYNLSQFISLKQGKGRNDG
jgi:curved DNA-binding protein CbpA